MSDWEESDSDTKSKPVAATVKPPIVSKNSKWEGEDEDEDELASDWEESSEEEEDKPTPAPVAPPKKKGTLKTKLAEKEAEKARRKAAGDGDNDDDDDDDDNYDSDAILDPREKARRDKEKELQADLNNATELFGAAALGSSSKELDHLISFQPRTKEDFQELSNKIIEYIIKRHQNKPLYPTFVEHHVRELSAPLKDVEVRKAASALTTLANEKQKEQREKTIGKKKTKGAAKPVLGSAKANNRVDTNLYDESLDDFGNDPNDFM